MSEENIAINSNELKELKPRIVTMTNILQEIDNKREELKEAAEAIEDEFNIKKKLINKIARTMYKHNYADIQSENEHFEFLYEAIAEGRKTGVAE